jgi:glycerophosphoryl diester phosphodiesterase
VIGHRGASALAPENTLAALRRAIEDGADGVEFDVRLSRDGIPVVIHDGTLRRTDLRAGIVEKMTAAELCQVDAGSWFNRARPHLAQNEYANERVPSLDAVLELFTAGGHHFANAKLYLEIKTEHVNSSATELTRKVVGSVLAHGLEERVVVLAFDLRAIAEARRISSVVRTGALLKSRLSQPAGIMRKQTVISTVIRSGANEIALHRSLATRGMVNLAIDRDLRVVVWTVNNPKWMIRAREWGVHAVISDDPGSMRAVQV